VSRHRAGRLVTERVVGRALADPLDVAVYLPPGYEDSPARRYPTLYLLHGRGDSRADWEPHLAELDALAEAGAVPPMVAVLPDAPWSNRGGYYVDSAYTGSAVGTSPGAAVETAFTQDLVAHVDASYRTAAVRGARFVGGYSMGGAGALRLAIVHPDLFAAALVLSPAVYVPTPPTGSSTRSHGAYGSGATLFDPERFAALSYPAALADFDHGFPVHLFVGVGDAERDADGGFDARDEAIRLCRTARRVHGVSARLRVYPGGHDWDTWLRGFREGLADVAGHLV
jgi:enterochelin esterase-like enzyme